LSLLIIVVVDGGGCGGVLFTDYALWPFSIQTILVLLIISDSLLRTWPIVSPLSAKDIRRQKNALWCHSLSWI